MPRLKPKTKTKPDQCPLVDVGPRDWSGGPSRNRTITAIGLGFEGYLHRNRKILIFVKIKKNHAIT